MLPGCFLTSEICFTLVLLGLVGQLSGSPLSPVRSDPDRCVHPPGRKKIGTGAAAQTDVASAAAVCM